MSNGGFWTREILEERLTDIITPFRAEQLIGCGYELTVGGEAFVSGENKTKVILKDSETITIPPGQLALIITAETIKAPLDALGMLSFKSGMKLRGLINVSGFHVDPGFEGKLVFSMYNAGPQNIQLSCGTQLFIVWFCSLHGPTAIKYDGKHNHQEHLDDGVISNISGHIPSPFTLDREIRSLKSELGSDMNFVKSDVAGKIKELQTYFKILAGTMLGMIAWGLRGCVDKPSSATSNPIPSINIAVGPTSPYNSNPAPTPAVPTPTVPATH